MCEKWLWITSHCKLRLCKTGLPWKTALSKSRISSLARALRSDWSRGCEGRTSWFRVLGWTSHTLALLSRTKQVELLHAAVLPVPGLPVNEEPIRQIRLDARERVESALT